MPYQFFDQTGDIGVRLIGRSREAPFASAALAAPELDLLLVDFLTELLYRFDKRGWLTRDVQVDLQERNGGWEPDGTLVGERLDVTRHSTKVLIKAVTYHGLEIAPRDGEWTANIVFDI